MLRELRIAGLGVVEALDLELHPGLNVLTGETGAGKTMVTVGLSLALGGRAAASLVRTGSTAARVEALFDASPTTDAAGWSEDGVLILARTIGADGKGSARAGGQTVPVSTLGSIGEALVEVHGQHESTRLLAASAQAAFLDRYAGPDHLASLAALASEVAALRAARDERDRLAALERDRERQMDVLAFQIRELESADVHVGELAELEAEAARLTHAKMLQKSLNADLSPADQAIMLESTPVPDKRERWRVLTVGGYSQEQLDSALESVLFAFGRMDEELANRGPWLAGKTYSLGDINMLAIVHRVSELDASCLDRKKLPHMMDWWDRSMARPAAKYTYAADTDEVPKRPRTKSIAGITEFRVA